MSNEKSSSILIKMLNAVGPGIMAIGYTIGTGSVTSMIVAGSSYGMQLLWVLFLSCFFSWILMNAYGTYALVTGDTALYGMRKHIRFGSTIAILIIIGISVGQWNSLIGILGITANALYEVIVVFIPEASAHSYGLVLAIAVSIIGLMYLILWKGSYSYLERVLTFFVAIMGLSFILSLFIVIPEPTQIAKGMIPTIPDVPGGKMLVAAFVGTTMAAATFLSRPLFLKGKGWTIENLSDQNRDSLWAALLIFFISASIMAIAAGTVYGTGASITKVLDMVTTLEPILGKFAVAIFLIGTLGAGLSSVFPILMITPILIADYRQGELDIKSTQFKVIAGLACLVGLTVPIFGANPINAQILSQVFNVFVLPLVIIAIIILLNKKELMIDHRASLKMNIGLTLSLVFACLVSYTGVVAILEKL